MAHGDFRQSLESLIIVDLSTPYDSTMTVTGILAEAHIGEYEDIIAELVFDCLDGLLNDSVRVRRPRARLIFSSGHTE
jgi:hypothetical protein